MLINFLDGTSREIANLSGANLGGANLGGADLGDADLGGANLRGADLYGADLGGATLEECTGLEQQSILPEGQIIGYKKLADGSIAKLRIAASVKRVNAYGSRKCRAESAFVLSSTGATSTHRWTFAYPKRGTVTPDKYDPDPRVQCSHGIHFFITEQEAKDYV
jgi:hypothetical protein